MFATMVDLMVEIGFEGIFKNMDVTIFFSIFIPIFLLVFFWQSLFKSSSYNLRILGPGFNKIPKLILKLSGIDSKKDLAYSDLTKEQKEKVSKYQEKLRSVSSCFLTFIDNQNLIHVEREDRSYFMHTDQTNNDLITMELGKTAKGEVINFTLYRKKRGLFKSSVLVGYLVNEDEENKRAEILFKFPVNLIKQNFFVKGLVKEFGLEEDTVVDYLGKNEMEDEETVYVITYQQKDLSGCEYDFWIHK